MQRFGEVQQTALKMRSRESDFLVVHSSRVGDTSKCSIYKFAEFHFNEVQELPCEDPKVWKSSKCTIRSTCSSEILLAVKMEAPRSPQTVWSTIWTIRSSFV
jgi:hypothetical protein